LLRQLLNGLRAPRRVSSRCQHHTFQPACIGSAVIGHVPVIGAIKTSGEMRGQRRRTKGPGARDDEVDVAPLGVHILEAATGIVLSYTGSNGLARRHVSASR